MNPEELSPWERDQVYNGLDVCVTRDCLDAMLPQLDEHTEKTYEFSKALQGPTLEMRVRGVLVDQARKAEVIDEYYAIIETLEAQLERIVLVLGTLDVLADLGNVADFFQHLQAGFVCATVCRPPQAGNAGRDGSERVGARRAAQAHRGRRGVLPPGRRRRAAGPGRAHRRGLRRLRQPRPHGIGPDLQRDRRRHARCHPHQRDPARALGLAQRREGPGRRLRLPRRQGLADAGRVPPAAVECPRWSSAAPRWSSEFERSENLYRDPPTVVECRRACEAVYRDHAR